MDILKSSLGQFYFAERTNRPPILVQVVGWTKGAESPVAKRRYVYVRKVPLNINHQITARGEWEFDYNLVEKYASEIKEPLKTNSRIVDGNAIIIDSNFLRFQGETLTLKSFNK